MIWGENRLTDTGVFGANAIPTIGSKKIPKSDIYADIINI